MARYSVETKLSPEETIRSATVYFGTGGLGLKVAAEEGACCASFEGGGGHVLVTAVEDGKRTEVVLETREWDHHVKQFMRTIASQGVEDGSGWGNGRANDHHPPQR
jgi:hypothetical protein